MWIQQVQKQSATISNFELSPWTPNRIHVPIDPPYIRIRRNSLWEGMQGSAMTRCLRAALIQSSQCQSSMFYRDRLKN